MPVSGRGLARLALVLGLILTNLTRRLGRTILTAFGVGVGVGVDHEVQHSAREDLRRERELPEVGGVSGNEGRVMRARPRGGDAGDDRRDGDRAADLDAAIAVCCAALTRTECENFFLHCGYGVT